MNHLPPVGDRRRSLEPIAVALQRSRERERGGRENWTAVAFVALLHLVGCGRGAGPDPESPISTSPQPEAILLDALEPLPHARHGHRIERLGTRLIAIGGFAGPHLPDRGTGESWIFERTGPNPAADDTSWSWRRGPALTKGKTFAGSFVHDDHCYAVGGTVERYDPGSSSWVERPHFGDLPETHFACGLFGGRLFTIGGFPAERGDFTLYDLTTGDRTRPGNPPEFESGHHFHIPAVLGGRLHLVGGMGAGLLQSHWVFDGEQWTSAAPPPAPTFAKFATYAVVRDTLYLFAHGLSAKYSPEEDRWTPISSPASIRAMPGTVVLDQHIVVIGGQELSGPSKPGEIHVFDANSGTWRTL